MAAKYETNNNNNNKTKKKKKKKKKKKTARVGSLDAGFRLLKISENFHNIVIYNLKSLKKKSKIYFLKNVKEYY